jgi:hypothetical protein
MKYNDLDKVFNALHVKERAKLGASEDAETFRAQAEAAYITRRAEIQEILAASALSRAQTLKRLNLSLYIVIAFVIISICGNLIQRNVNILVYIQSACTLILFPIFKLIEQAVTKQSQIEFTSAFLPDLDAKEALKAIDHLYQSLYHPENVKKSLAAK